jgi:hypothetical protein
MRKIYRYTFPVTVEISAGSAQEARKALQGFAYGVRLVRRRGTHGHLRVAAASRPVRQEPKGKRRLKTPTQA